MNKLDFCVVGPQRTGSSWLDQVLRTHPNCSLPQTVKETFFWDKKYERGVDYFFSMFKPVLDTQSIKGEIGPTYFHQQEVIERLHRHNPECKIVIIERDPVEKALSLFAHHYAKGRVGDLQSAVRKYPEIIESGKYEKWIANWRAHFGQSVFVLSYSKISTSPSELVNQLFSFLNLQEIEIQSSLLNNPYGSRTFPKYRLLAKLMAYAATTLRKYDLHSAANFGKMIGLKKVFAGGNQKLPISQSDIDWLKNQFAYNG